MDLSDNVPIRAQRNSRGHLSREEIAYVLWRWNSRRNNHGTVSALSKELGVSHVAISNVILRETGLQPANHQTPAAQQRKM